MHLKDPKFIKSATRLKDFPTLKKSSGDLVPEIAIVGRSNVGKSSLLNDLFQKKGFVKTSATPGKTQLVNFFLIEETVCFVDLPGYGYAEVPPEIRKQWGPMVQGYLESRPTLQLILFLFDIRRTPKEDDLQLLEWIRYNDLAMILVLTKCDKVNGNELRANTKKIVEAFQVPCCIHYSSTKNQGRKELIKSIEEAIQ
jgi:GTP-binding protein